MTKTDLHIAYKKDVGVYPPHHKQGDFSEANKKAYVEWLETILLKNFNLIDMMVIGSSDISDLIDYINKHGK